MDDKHVYYEVGDIVLANQVDTRIRWIGVIVGFVQDNRELPKVMFWKPNRSQMADRPLVMTTGGLMFIGRVPDGVEWDVVKNNTVAH